MVKILGTESSVFLSVVIFSMVYFGLLNKLMVGQFQKRRRLPQILFSFLNGGIAVYIEIISQGRSNLAVISLITLVLILEMYLLNRKKEKFYLYFHGYWLTSLQFQTAYLFACALVNLFISQLWVTGSIGHRFAIFNVTLFWGALNFALQLKVPKRFMLILSDILTKRSNTYLLGIYTMASTTILAVSGSLISRMLYEEVELEVKTIMYPDLILKNLLILGGSLLIVVYLVRQEMAVRETLELNEELETEKEFREKFHSNALLSYCANITKDCFVKEKSEFVIPETVGYRESIMDFIMETVHPEDMERLSGLITEEYYEKRLKENPRYSIKIRVASKAILALVNNRLTEEEKSRLKENREWIWVEFHVTIVQEARTSDILTYISLSNIDEEMMEKEQLAQAINTDSLTGLLNRSGLEHFLTEHLQRVPNGGTLFMIDMDHFKSVNDQLGHPMGDKVLKDTADILRSVFRDGDYICRLGGDEFCVFARNLEDKNIVITRARELGKRGRRTYTSEAGNIHVSVSFSIGVAISQNGKKTTYEELYEQADQMLYKAKEKGRDCYVIREER